MSDPVDDTPERDLCHEVEVLLGRRAPGLVRPMVSLEHLECLDAQCAELADRYVMTLFQLAKLGDQTALMELESRGYDFATASTLVFPNGKQVHQ